MKRFGAGLLVRSDSLRFIGGRNRPSLGLDLEYIHCVRGAPVGPDDDAAEQRIVDRGFAHLGHVVAIDRVGRLHGATWDGAVIGSSAAI
jgi:hypothetical protein